MRWLRFHGMWIFQIDCLNGEEKLKVRQHSKYCCKLMKKDMVFLVHGLSSPKYTVLKSQPI